MAAADTEHQERGMLRPNPQHVLAPLATAAASVATPETTMTMTTTTTTTTSPTTSSAGRHPRRRAAHESVSLLHSPALVPQASSLTSTFRPKHRRRSGTLHHAHAANEQQSTQPSTSSGALASSSAVSKPTKNLKHSSGESSNAEGWFESSNNNVAPGANSLLDNEPPFFLRNSSSSETPPDLVAQRTARLRAEQSNIPYRTTTTAFNDANSSTDDFRSVIDDLTVANKKLKRKLRKYERLYDAHLQGEKLFEVRFHGLSSDKKRELEETLKKFAMTIEQTSSRSPQTSKKHSAPNLAPHHTTSSYSSIRAAESGYVSMSASGQNSSSGPSALLSDNHKRMSKAAFERHQQDVRTYLHNTPAGLLPKADFAPLSENAKKRMVVRRLEQIFAGRSPPSAAGMQTDLQQEIAQSAARADRRAIEATGQKPQIEGLREARIMPDGEPEDAIKVSGSRSGGSGPANVAALSGNGSSGPQATEKDLAVTSSLSSSPEQRPTRPLDLDPQRAQVPSENMEYIRHLGFSPPEFGSTEAQPDGHGWIYLNLLVNMAQLHTISVTTEFVQKAVGEYSSKLELSHDGRKVRWKGGQDFSRLTSDSSSDLNSGSPNELDESKKAAGKLPLRGNRDESVNDQHSSTFHKGTGTSSPQNATNQQQLVYVPLFSHWNTSDDDNDVSMNDNDGDSSSDELVQARAAKNSSGFASSGTRSFLSKKRQADGPIIFYNNAKFCTDLTGDERRPPPPMLRKGSSVTTTSSSDVMPLGGDGDGGGLASSDAQLSGVGEPRGPLHDTMITDGPTTIVRQLSNDEDETESSPQPASEDSNSDSPRGDTSFAFEVSGVGGVQPQDHFEISVRSLHTRVVGVKRLSPSSSHHTRSKSYPAKIRNLLSSTSPGSEETQSTKQRLTVVSEIISTDRKDLPPSTLPPPTFLPFDSSSGDYDSDFSSAMVTESHAVSNRERPPPSAAPQLMAKHAQSILGPILPYSSDSDDEEDDDDDDVEGSGESLDLLESARRENPVEIAAREREYDSALADRLAQEIPAGSSAATVGGGSGFNSPFTPVTHSTGIERKASSPRSLDASNPPSGSMKRSRTNDSLVVHGKAPRLN